MIVMLSHWCLRVVHVTDLITFAPYPVPWALDMIRPHKPGWLNGRVQCLPPPLSLSLSLSI